MHLSQRQLDRFFDLLDQLLVFANERLHLVEGLSAPIVGEQAEMKAALVCELLWDNRAVIDEFVRLNPNRMPARDLQAVAAWSDALVGEFMLVRHERGQAIMLHETGLYSVAGLDVDLSERLSQAPDILHAALLPYEGVIVTDGLEMSSGIPLNAEELRVMEEASAAALATGVASTADELRVRAQAYNSKLRELELDALMSSIELEARQARDGERLPEGYHRGVLAGLSPEERERVVTGHLAELAQKAQEQAGEELARLLQGRSAERQAEDGGSPAGSEPGPEGRAAGRDRAHEEREYEQERDDAALNCADALAQMCGLMTLKEAYAAYSTVVFDVIDLERFVAALMAEDEQESCEFTLQEWRGQSYLMHFTVSDAYARDWVARQHARELQQKAAEIKNEQQAAAALTRMLGEVAEGTQNELASLDDYRAHLLDCHKRTARRPLSPMAVEGKYIDELAQRPAVVQLRDFLDAHVPDGQDDYLYADLVIEDLIAHSIDSGDAMAYLDEIERAGACNCTEDTGLVLRLAENAYGALPSWEYNGWSPQEVMEQLMGKRIFYNVRGEMLHPSPNEPCPCGSGRPYGECHGAL